MNYNRAIGECAGLGGRLFMSTRDFERQFALIAAKKDGLQSQGKHMLN